MEPSGGSHRKHLTCFLGYQVSGAKGASRYRGRYLADELCSHSLRQPAHHLDAIATLPILRLIKPEHRRHLLPRQKKHAAPRAA